MVTYSRSKSITIPHTITVEEFDSALEELSNIFKGSKFLIAPIRYRRENGVLKANNQGYKIHAIYDPDHWKKYGESFLETTPEACLEFYERIVKYKGTASDEKVELRRITMHSHSNPLSLSSDDYSERQWEQNNKWNPRNRNNLNDEYAKFSYFSMTVFSRDFKKVRDTMKALIGQK